MGFDVRVVTLVITDGAESAGFAVSIEGLDKDINDCVSVDGIPDFGNGISPDAVVVVAAVATGAF